jgi:hypothetical protein
VWHCELIDRFCLFSLADQCNAMQCNAMQCNAFKRIKDSGVEVALSRKQAYSFTSSIYSFTLSLSFSLLLFLLGLFLSLTIDFLTLFDIDIDIFAFLFLLLTKKVIQFKILTLPLNNTRDNKRQ